VSLREELRASPLFHHLPEPILDRVLPTVLQRSFVKNELLVQQGESAAGFHVIVSGRVKIRVSSSSGREQVLHFFGAGDSFGEAAVLGAGAYPGDAVALTAGRLAFIPAEPFLRELGADPDFARAIMRSMAQRLVEFARIIENLATREVKARLACYLMQQQLDGFDESLELPVGKGELARLLGTTAESLSRALRELSDQGAIRVEGKRITLLEPGILLELSEE
jgi:CRP/FNR family transcriptional regulator